MTLLPAIEAYVSFKRSLGAVFVNESRLLHALLRTLGDIPVTAISAEMCQRFCRGEGPPTRFWERKHETLRGFFKFLVSRGYLGVTPLPEPGPRVGRAFQPYIYSQDEVRRLLDATTSLANDHGSSQPQTVRTLLLVLYGAGLRPSEGLRLRWCDVDVQDGVLSIWDTKFFKSRLVPIGERLNSALAAYRDQRQHGPMPSGARSAFFATPTGKAISLNQLERVFVQLRGQAHIQRPATDRWQPRLHDLRHSFASARLLAWYRAGADVQALLPLLAVYLGHRDLAGTQTYLSMTSELLTEASRRFELYAAPAPETHHD